MTMKGELTTGESRWVSDKLMSTLRGHKWNQWEDKIERKQKIQNFQWCQQQSKALHYMSYKSSNSY